MRQTEQKEFTDALNNVAIGGMTNANVDLMKTREVKEGEIIPEEAIYLFRYNVAVDKRNDERITNHEGNEVRVNAIDDIKGDIEEGILNELKTKRYPDTRGLPSTLRLKIGIKYMITSNIDTED